MKGKLYLDEAVDNKFHKFGEADKYYPVRVKINDDCEATALFTLEQIEVALQRANRNTEDIPDKSLWELLTD